MLSVEIDIEEPTNLFELDLRGLRFEEAMKQFENRLELSMSFGMERLKVIHGLGTGAIKEGVRKRLKGIPYVKDFFSASQDQGGDGVTIILLN